MKEVLSSSTREQQLYIEQLHQDLDSIEKHRIKMYKEEEAERAKLLEDTIKLYEKTRELEDAQVESQRRIHILSEKMLRMRQQIEKRAVSPTAAGMIVKESQEYDTTLPGTPKRGNGSGERSTIEAPRIFTANTISMERRKRKVYTSGRPSIS